MRKEQATITGVCHSSNIAGRAKCSRCSTCSSVAYHSQTRSKTCYTLSKI